jgi:hypothetical protein
MEGTAPPMKEEDRKQVSVQGMALLMAAATMNAHEDYMAKLALWNSDMGAQWTVIEVEALLLTMFCFDLIIQQAGEVGCCC